MKKFRKSNGVTEKFAHFAHSLRNFRNVAIGIKKQKRIIIIRTTCLKGINGVRKSNKLLIKGRKSIKAKRIIVKIRWIVVNRTIKLPEKEVIREG